MFCVSVGYSSKHLIIPEDSVARLSDSGKSVNLINFDFKQRHLTRLITGCFACDVIAVVIYSYLFEMALRLGVHTTNLPDH